MSDPKKKKIIVYFCISIAALVIIGICVRAFVLSFIPYTDDCYVEGNQIVITPLKEGFIKSIHTDDTFLVKKGQLLIELDETDARIALDQARENLANTVRDVCRTFHQVFAYRAEIAVKEAELIKNEQDLEHRTQVIDVGGVSVEDFEHAQAYARTAFYELEMSKNLYQKELALVQGTTIKRHPLVLAAAQALEDAWVQLYRCKIYSPVEGLAAQRRAQVGMWVNKGESLLSVIPLDQIWVNANYKETQMKKMRIGQSVRITSDLYGKDVVYNGRIVGLPGGAGNAYTILPPENLSGNWIKIVQRLPVRVALDKDELCRHPLRIGLSMEATVNFDDGGGELIPKNNDDAPLYETRIYADEICGSKDLIERIVKQNLDPSLAMYAETPLLIEDRQ
ncbi:MAG: efflux RND transporter periplasmic adaptor subunit [Simkaniaceae bacterium]|nr:efflux RND transporter periplasmic adaptor subunit [Simkaniaceae bacterium]